MNRSDQDTERRRFTRIHFDAKTELILADQSWDVQLIDISFNGLMVEANETLPFSAGQEVEAIVHLLGNDITIRTPVALAHCKGRYYGFLIENMEIDSLTQLRRLVELNLGDEGLLERELDHLFLDHD